MELTANFDSDTCRKTIALIAEHSDVIELRALGGGRPDSGFFDDPDALVSEAGRLSGKVEGIYVTMNELGPDLRDRITNQVRTARTGTLTGDSDVRRRRWLFIDLDPVRESKTSSSGAEHDAAISRAKACRDFLHDRGWPDPVLADSGNGAHLLYRMDRPNDADTDRMVASILETLALRFGDGAVEIDQAVKNPGRLVKLYGTVACKGIDTKERPHRVARLLEVPDRVAVVTVKRMKQLAAEAPAPTQVASEDGRGGAFDLRAWISKHSLDVAQEAPWKGGMKHVLTECPWNEEHTNRSAYIIQFENGAIAAGCHHDGCSGKKWKDLRDTVEPEWRDRERQTVVYESEGVYVRETRGKNASRVPITSFAIKLKERVSVNGREASRVDFVTPAGKIFRDIVIERDDWNSKAKFMRTFPSIDLQFEGYDQDVQRILGVVASVEGVPERKGTQQLGYHEDVWVVQDGAINADGWTSDPPRSYVPIGGQGPAVEERFGYRKLDDAAYRQLVQGVARNLPRCNTPKVMIPLIGWFMACPYKVLIRKRLGHFSLLNAWGSMGSGKTSILEQMSRLSGWEGGELFSCTETEFAMLRKLSLTTSIPIALDEYKPHDIQDRDLNKLHRYLRRVYGGDVESRGRPDLSVQSFPLSSPVCVAGEVPFSQPALLDRTIPVRMSRDSLRGPDADTYGQAFDNLRQLPLEGFMPQYIPAVYQDGLGAEYEVADDMADAFTGTRKISTRVRDSITIALFGYLRFCTHCEQWGTAVDVIEDYQGVVDALLGELVGDGAEVKNGFDKMLEELATMAEIGCVQAGKHYTHDEGQLRLRLPTCIALFRNYARQTQSPVEVLDERAYRQQLRERAVGREGGYVVAATQSSHWRYYRQNKRAVVIDVDKAVAVGLDLEGFSTRAFDD